MPESAGGSKDPSSKALREGDPPFLSRGRVVSKPKKLIAAVREVVSLPVGRSYEEGRVVSGGWTHVAS